MPATGNNRRSKEKLLSIRLSSDGLSFWTAEIDGPVGGTWPECTPKAGSDSAETLIALSREPAPAERIRSAFGKCIDASGWSGWPVRIMADTLKTVLVPAQLFDPAQADDYLAVHNIVAGPGDRIIVSQLTGDNPAAVVMACDRAIIDAATEVFGGKAWITSPFDTAGAYRGFKHKKKDAGKVFTTLYFTEKNVYITVQAIPGGEWRYCEALPYAGAADILYYMQELSAQFDIRKTPLYIRGTGAEHMAKALRKPFKRCKCV